jgi:hypothetical protein
MTVEKTCFVDPGDILALRIQCKCGAAGIVPTARAGTIGPVLEGKCMYCGRDSGLVKDSTALEDIVRFGTMLGRLAANLKGSNIELSLQMKCPE